MNCPYLNCQHNNIQNFQESCPDCKRQIIVCPECNVGNRIYAKYCRNCGERIIGNDNNWQSCKGSSQRSGLSRYVISTPFESLQIKEIGEVNLSAPCQCLLIYHNILFCISQNGEIKLMEIGQNSLKQLNYFTAGNEIYCNPAIANGSLFVATKNSIQAYTLGMIASKMPSAGPRWEFSVEGIPVGSLFPCSNRLYFNLFFKHNNQHREIHAIDQIVSTTPIKPECIHAGPYVSLVAGNMTKKVKNAYFLSSSNGDINIHMFDHSQKDHIQTSIIPVKKPESDFIPQIPIAVIGAKIFAVFKNKETLFRIDATSGKIDLRLCQNTKEFSMAGVNDPVVVNPKGIFIKRIDQQIELSKERQLVKGHPVILRNTAIVFGTKNGTVKMYDLMNPGLSKDWNLSIKNSESITSIAASKNIIAAGNQNGKIKVCRLEKK